VSLDEADLTVDVSIVAERILIAIELFGDLQRRRRVLTGDVYQSKTALNPIIAYALSRLACIQCGDVVLDPFAGVCTIGIEAANYCPFAHYINSDVWAPSLLQGTRNNRTSRTPLCDFLVCDARLLPIRRLLIDKVITDLPWGKRHLSFNSIAKLYPAFLRSVARVLKLGGKMVLLTACNNLLFRQLQVMPTVFRIDQVIPVGIGGLAAKVFLVTKHGEYEASKR